ncbi:MAG: hypothetical protein GY811_02905 [Myxococcales bacterium]|nr:hypothetical protein [Myxococcales bacterium]
MKTLLDDFERANLKIAASRIAGVGEALDRAWDSFHARMTASKLGHCSKPIDRESMGVGALYDEMQVWLRAVEELKGVGLMLEDLPAYIDWLKERAKESKE